MWKELTVSEVRLHIAYLIALVPRGNELLKIPSLDAKTLSFQIEGLNIQSTTKRKII